MYVALYLDYSCEHSSQHAEAVALDTRRSIRITEFRIGVRLAWIWTLRSSSTFAFIASSLAAFSVCVAAFSTAKASSSRSLAFQLTTDQALRKGGGEVGGLGSAHLALLLCLVHLDLSGFGRLLISEYLLVIRLPIRVRVNLALMIRHPCESGLDVMR